MPSYVRAGIRKCARIRALSNRLKSDKSDEYARRQLEGKTEPTARALPFATVGLD